MAQQTKTARYTEQMPWVATAAQAAEVSREASGEGKRRPVSKASVIRALVDEKFGLVDGEYPEGDPRRGDSAPAEGGDLPVF